MAGDQTPKIPSSSARKPGNRTSAVLVPQGVLAGQPDVPLDRPVTTVGSNESARLHLVSRTVSKGHALFVNSNGMTYVADLASRTGVLVNGKLVRDVDLKTGDRVQIGKFVFRFRSPANLAPAQLIASAPPAAVIVVGSPAKTISGRVFQIGRRENSDISFATDSAVSAGHAVIFEMDGRWYMRDLGSRTGTTINGKAIHQQVLNFGDRIAIGSASILFQPGAAVEPEMEPEFAPEPELESAVETDTHTEPKTHTEPETHIAPEPVAKEEPLDLSDFRDEPATVEAEEFSSAVESSAAESPESTPNLQSDEPIPLELEADEISAAPSRDWKSAFPVEAIETMESAESSAESIEAESTAIPLEDLSAGDGLSIADEHATRAERETTEPDAAANEVADIRAIEDGALEHPAVEEFASDTLPAEEEQHLVAPVSDEIEPQPSPQIANEQIVENDATAHVEVIAAEILPADEILATAEIPVAAAEDHASESSTEADSLLDSSTVSSTTSSTAPAPTVSAVASSGLLPPPPEASHLIAPVEDFVFVPTDVAAHTDELPDVIFWGDPDVDDAAEQAVVPSPVPEVPRATPREVEIPSAVSAETPLTAAVELGAVPAEVAKPEATEAEDVSAEAPSTEHVELEAAPAEPSPAEAAIPQVSEVEAVEPETEFSQVVELEAVEPDAAIPHSIELDAISSEKATHGLVDSDSAEPETAISEVLDVDDVALEKPTQEVIEPKANSPEVTADEVAEILANSPQETSHDVTEIEAAAPEVTAEEVAETEAVAPEATTGDVAEIEAVAPEVTAEEVAEIEAVAPEVTVGEVAETETVAPEVTTGEVAEIEAVSPEVTTGDVAEVKAVAPEVTLDDVAEIEAVSPEATTGDVAEIEAIAPEATTGEVAEIDAVSPEVTIGDVAEIEAVAPEATTGEVAEIEAIAPEATTGEVAEIDAVSPEVTIGDVAEIEAVAPEVTAEEVAEIEAVAPEVTVGEVAETEPVAPEVTTGEVAEIEAVSPEAKTGEVAEIEAVLPEATTGEVAEVEAVAPEVTLDDVAEIEAVSPEVTPGYVAEINAVAPEVASDDVAAIEAIAPEVTVGEVAETETVAPEVTTGEVAEIEAVSPEVTTGDVAEINAVAPEVASDDVAAIEAIAPEVTIGDVAETEAVAPEVTLDEVAELEAVAPEVTPDDVAEIEAIAPEATIGDVAEIEAVAPEVTTEEVAESEAIASESRSDELAATQDAIPEVVQLETIAAEAVITDDFAESALVVPAEDHAAELTPADHAPADIGGEGSGQAFDELIDEELGFELLGEDLAAPLDPPHDESTLRPVDSLPMAESTGAPIDSPATDASADQSISLPSGESHISLPADLASLAMATAESARAYESLTPHSAVQTENLSAPDLSSSPAAEFPVAEEVGTDFQTPAAFVDAEAVTAFGVDDLDFLDSADESNVARSAGEFSGITALDDLSRNNESTSTGEPAGAANINSSIGADFSPHAMSSAQPDATREDDDGMDEPSGFTAFSDDDEFAFDALPESLEDLDPHSPLSTDPSPIDGSVDPASGPRIEGIDGIEVEPQLTDTTTPSETAATSNVDLPSEAEDRITLSEELSPAAVEPSPAPQASSTTGPSIFGFDFEGGSFLGGMPISLAGGPTTPPPPPTVPAPEKVAAVSPVFDARAKATSGLGEMLAAPAAAAIAPAVKAAVRATTPPRPTLNAPSAPAALTSLSGLVNDAHLPWAAPPVIPPTSRAAAPVQRPGTAPKKGLSSTFSAPGAAPRNVEVFSQLSSPIGVEVFGGKPGDPNQFNVPDTKKTDPENRDSTPADTVHQGDTAGPTDTALAKGSAAAAAMPAKKKRRSRLPWLLPLLFIIPGGISYSVMRYWPVSRVVVGTLQFDGYDSLEQQQVADAHKFQEEQKALLQGNQSDDVRLIAHDILKSKNVPTGFTENSVDYNSAVRPGVSWTKSTLKFSLGTTAEEDVAKAQVDAVLTALAQKDRDLDVARNKARANAAAAKQKLDQLASAVKSKTDQWRALLAKAQAKPEVPVVIKAVQDAENSKAIWTSAKSAADNNAAYLAELQSQDPSKAIDVEGDALVKSLKDQLQPLYDQIAKLRGGGAIDAGSKTIIGTDVSVAATTQPQGDVNPLIVPLQRQADAIATRLEIRRSELASQAALGPEQRRANLDKQKESLSIKLTSLTQAEQQAKAAYDIAQAKADDLNNAVKAAKLAGLEADDVLSKSRQLESDLIAAQTESQQREVDLANCVTVGKFSAGEVESKTDIRIRLACVGAGLAFAFILLKIIGEVRRPKLMKSVVPAAAPLVNPAVKIVPWPQPKQLKGLESAPSPSHDESEQMLGV